MTENIFSKIILLKIILSKIIFLKHDIFKKINKDLITVIKISIAKLGRGYNLHELISLYELNLRGPEEE